MLFDIDERSMRCKFKFCQMYHWQVRTKHQLMIVLIQTMIRHIGHLLKDSRHPMQVNILNGTCRRIWKHMHWNILIHTYQLLILMTVFWERVLYLEICQVQLPWIIHQTVYLKKIKNLVKFCRISFNKKCSTLLKTQFKIQNTVLHLIKTATDSNSSQDKLNQQDFKNLAEQTVVMLGQSFHHVNNRRLSVLTSIIKEHKAK